MQAAVLEDYLHRHIPLAKAMGIRVVSAEPDAVTLHAPLAPNINHRETVFGGSAAALATLAAWTLLEVRLSLAGLPARVVIQRSSMDYLRPIAGDFTAKADLTDDAAWDRFVRTLGRRGKARIALEAVVEHAGSEAARFAGEFVAVAAPGEPARSSA